MTNMSVTVREKLVPRPNSIPTPFTKTSANAQDKEEEWRRHIRSQIDEELNRRVRDALETPPLERLRRRQLESQAKAAAARKEADDLNAHLDLTDKERDYILNKKRLTSKLQTKREDTAPSIHNDQPNRFMLDAQQTGSNEGESCRVYQGEGYVPPPRSQQIQSLGYSDDWEFSSTRRTGKATYPDGVAPLLPHPVFKNIINPNVEPLYTSMPVIPGAKTYENQVTPYTQKWRGICIVFDSEKSPREQSMEPPKNPLYAPNLIFESRFESGNLRQARRVGQFEYELVLKTDVFTKRHTQWYYFRVQNMVPGIIYKFRIVNLLKRDSLYNYGMRPLMYSDAKANEENIGWIRQGHHISYGRNVQHTICPLLSRELAYYELEWQMEFPYANDTCYLAHCYPYTYTDLTNDLNDLLADPIRSQYVKKDSMCETKSGNSCYLLTITDFDVKEKKEYVVVSSRVHPGESNSSWMLKGLVDHITSDQPDAMEMRKRFVFKVVPMLNPDGVVVGNYRCSLQAKDLNRNYRHPRRDNFPTIFSLKKLVEDLQNTVGVYVYCDFHGHSRKANVFMYGNNPSSAQAGNVKAYLEERMLPFCISKVGQGMFSFESCKFAIRRCKESTGRVVMYRHFNIKNSFTMEATFSGTVIDKNGSRHFNQRDFMNAGKYFAQGVLKFSDLQKDKEKETEVVIDLTREITQQILNASGITITPDDGRDLETVLSDHLNPPKPSKEILPTSGTLPSVTGMDKATVLRLLDNISEETISKCVTLLEKLSLPTETRESESSDSDSESDPEVAEENKGKKKKKNKRRGKDKKLPAIGSHDGSGGKSSRQDGQITRTKWSNPYDGRSNGGVPCFSEERSMERAAKRMAELQRRMEEKSNRNQDEDLSDSYYDEMAALQAEEDFHRSMKLASQASPTGRYSQHMDFLQKADSDHDSKRKASLTHNPNQFDMMKKRSRTEIFETKRSSRWPSSSIMETWNEANSRSLAFSQSMEQIDERSSTLSEFRLPPHTNTSSTLSSNFYQQKTEVQTLSKEYSELLASRIRSTQTGSRLRHRNGLGNLGKSLQVNPLHNNHSGYE